MIQLPVKFTAILILFVLLTACSSTTPSPNSRRLTILAINDVYNLDGLNNGNDGGLARVRTLRKKLEAEGAELLFLHAGDFLYPSLLSDKYGGEQMVDLLNRMDGDSERFDSRMLITFGNHEFDKAKLKDAKKLNQRIDQSQFNWLGSDIVFKHDPQGKPYIASRQLLDHTILEINGIKVGLFSLTTDMVKPAYIEAFRPPLETARRLTRQLRDQGAEVIVALTHLSVDQDQTILQQLGAGGPDLIIGGHEHQRLQRCVVTDGIERCVLKADADAITATVAEIELSPAGVRLVERQAYRLDHDTEPDPAMIARAKEWLMRYVKLTCPADDLKCLEQIIGHTSVKLIGDEHQIRQSETNLGDWVADQMLDAFNHSVKRGDPAQVALINAGSLRLNQNIPAGPIIEHNLKALLPYRVALLKIKMSGVVLKAVLEHATTDWPGHGRWLQVSGITFTHQPAEEEGNRIKALRFNDTNGGELIRDNDTIWVVTSDFLRGDHQSQRCGDDYCMIMQISESDVIQPESKLSLMAVLKDALKKAGDKGIAPHCDGRIDEPGERCGE